MSIEQGCLFGDEPIEPGVSTKEARKREFLRLSNLKTDKPRELGSGVDNRPPGQSLTWYQWRAYTGEAEERSGPAWEAYCRGDKPRTWLKNKGAKECSE